MHELVARVMRGECVRYGTKQKWAVLSLSTISTIPRVRTYHTKQPSRLCCVVPFVCKGSEIFDGLWVITPVRSHFILNIVHLRNELQLDVNGMRHSNRCRIVSRQIHLSEHTLVHLFVGDRGKPDVIKHRFHGALFLPDYVLRKLI